MRFYTADSGWRNMATRLSQLEIQEITQLLEQGKALPEKYRHALFVDQQVPTLETTAAASPEPVAPLDVSSKPTLLQSKGANSPTILVKLLLDDNRVQQVIKKYVGMVVPRDHDKHSEKEVGALAVECTKEIAEIAPDVLRDKIAPHLVQQMKRQNETKPLIVSEGRTSELFHAILEKLNQRESDMEAVKKGTDSMPAFVEFLLNEPQVQEVIRKYIGMVAPIARDRYNRNPFGALADKCTSEIANLAPQILQQPGNEEYLLRWQNVTKLLVFSENPNSELFHIVLGKLNQRGPEVIREREAKEKDMIRARQLKEEAEENEATERTLAKYADIVNSFLSIAERKVSVLDEYGDEQMCLLPNLVDDCVAKIAGREGESETQVKAALKKGGFPLCKRRREFLRIREILPAMFVKYHADQKGKKKTIEEMASLSGVDFETAVGRILLEHGWYVSATAATGDQGADIIASKGERRVIIQAKRYSGAVGNKAVQEVVGAIPFYDGTEGCVVTNSTFTPSARALAQKNHIRLIDGSRFEEIAEL